VRAQVVLLRGDCVLLARHVRAEGPYWVLPGGSVEAGETPEDAAVREVREETGLDVELERLLFVEQPRRVGTVTTREPRYTYLGRILAGSLQHTEDVSGGHAEKGYLAGVEWMPFELPEYDAATKDTLQRVADALARAGTE
jgi:8-oxo-dGTP pyrophosphatase MutT (NUDIX family)